MIVIIHSLYFCLQYCLKLFKHQKCLKAFIKSQDNAICETVDAEENIQFDPPVYKQRYGAVQQVLLDNKWRSEIKKVVDFGCAEFGLFQFIKRLCRIENVLEVDVDEDLLKDNLYRLRPLTMDYLSRRTEPLIVEVLVGSISDPDARLLDVDVVIGIEIIEHLFPDTLDALPYNIFGVVKPKIAVFTTPNADFNVLFPNFKKFRHADHKFEWSRQQFKSWATNIVSRFPEYTVSFLGIGKGPAGTEHLGCCSQMAIFEIKNISESGETKLQSNLHMETSIDMLNSSCTCKKCITDTSFGVCTYYGCTEKYHECLRSLSSSTDSKKQIVDSNIYYDVVDIIEYPFEVDERSPDQKILDELKYRMCLMGNINGRFFNDDLERIEIPLTELIFNQYTHFTTVPEAREILSKAEYKIEECLICGDLETCVIYEPEMDSRASTPSITSHHSNITDRENWSTATTEGETSEWEVNSDIQRGSWTDNTNNSDIEHAEVVENVYEIVDNLITNLELECSIPDCFEISNMEENSPNKKKCNNLQTNGEAMQVMYDSGYYKSNTTLTTSTQSGSDLLDGDILDEHCFNPANTDELPNKIQVSHIINICNGSDVHINNDEHNTLTKKSISPNFIEPFETRNNKTPTPGIGTATRSPISPEVNLYKSLHLKDNIKESTPGTSNVKKKKKYKRFENDDDDSSGSIFKNEDAENKVIYNEDDRIVPEVVEVAQVPEPIVENGDLANNNRDMEGNNYPNAQNEPLINGHNMDGNDNENVVLQNIVPNDDDEVQRNEDVENRNAEVEEEEGNNEPENTHSDDGHTIHDLEIEFASREALFDPDSEIDLLEEFNSVPAVVMAANSEDIDQYQSVVVVGLNVNAHSNVDGNAVLPNNADPFPNWLLHLLGTDIVEDGEAHDEPHFYCQGDGLGVHPSFIEDDFDEDHSSSGSDTTSTGSTSDDAIAEPSVSEVEAISLPDDATDGRLEQNIPPVVAVQEPVRIEDQATASIAAGTSSGNESADEYFDTCDESLSGSSNRSENKK